MKRLLNHGVLHMVMLCRHEEGDALVQDCGVFDSENAVRFYMEKRFTDHVQPCCSDPDHLGWLLLSDDYEPTSFFIRCDPVEHYTLIEGVLS